ncbi:MAG: sugar-binding domain-containing protein [Ferruginibacter sp.]
MKKILITIIVLSIAFVSVAQKVAWKQAEGPLQTQWTSLVKPDNAHPEYPRPQMVREKWKNLNGLWEYAITNVLDEPKKWDGQILVPFCAESMLSGVEKKIGPSNMLWYKRKFTIPADWKEQHVALHFEAVDWKMTVWVNGKSIGGHSGGYDDFSFDITDALKKKGEQEIIISVWDPSNDGTQPAGKQYNKPRSIWYTSVTGIWQTVWIEPVPEFSINDFKIMPDVDKNNLQIFVPGKTIPSGYSIEAIAYDNNIKVGTVTGKLNDTLSLKLSNQKLWSPSNPFLYDLVINLYNNGKKVDAVKSYFGMRSIKLGKDAKGITRLLLNNQPLFQYGPLDQGFWPDGIYTAPTDDALKYDIEIEKKLGFNMIRKHVKVESKRWYYWCDKIGMLVWQDMPSGDRHIRKDEADIIRDAQSSLEYKTELKAMVNQHFNSPCIVTWVPFNEGWGQFQTDTIVEFVRNLDHTRLISATSGWADRKTGDMSDIHVYPGPAMPEPESNRAAVLGEFGGQALIIKDHLWQSDFSFAPGHIRTSQTLEQLDSVYKGLVIKLMELKSRGLSAAVYTQTTDVETEVNGMMTYDRKIIKLDVDKLKAMHDQLIKQ